MFSLIITIIAIALVAVLAIASIYYGSSSLTKGKTEADSARVINEGNQIQAAVAYYQIEHSGASPATLDELVTEGYLKAVPEGQWDFGSGYVARTDLSLDQCLKINQKIGLDSVPGCSTLIGDEPIVCCDDTL